MKKLKRGEKGDKVHRMPHDTVAIHPRKARHLGLSLLRTGSRLVLEGSTAGALLGKVGDDPALAGPLVEAGVWAEEQGLRVLAVAARVEAWEAEGALPPGVARWDHRWDDGFADPVDGHRAAQAALAAWHEGDQDLFVRLVGSHGADPVFAVTLTSALGAGALAGPVSDRWLGLTGRPADPGDPELVAALGEVLATGSSVGIGPRPRELAAALDALGVPAVALGLLVPGRPPVGGRPFETGWLVELGAVVLPGVGTVALLGGTAGRLPAGSSGADALPERWAGDLRVPVLEAIAADPAASAQLLVAIPPATLLTAGAEIPAGGAAVTGLLRSAATSAPADRSAAATAVIRGIGSAPSGARYQDPVLVAAVQLVEPYLDALRPADLVGRGYPPPSLAIGSLDAGRFIATVAASDAAAETLASATYDWLDRELPVVTALPEPVAGLRVLGGTSGRIIVAVEASRCSRADEVDDDRERLASLSAQLGTLSSLLAPDPVRGLLATVRTEVIRRKIDDGIDHRDECRADLQMDEALRAARLGLMVLDATWANRGANLLFATEGGRVPPPPREVLDDTGDHLRDDLDRHRLGLLVEWSKHPDVVVGLPGLDAFNARFAAAGPR